MTGIRGEQVEFYDLELDRLINTTSSVLATAIDLDLTSTGNNILLSATQKYYIAGVILRVAAIENVTTVPEASVGISPSTNNVFDNSVLVNLNQQNSTYTYWNNLNTGAMLNNGEDLILTVNTAATADLFLAIAYVIGVSL